MTVLLHDFFKIFEHSKYVVFDIFVNVMQFSQLEKVEYYDLNIKLLIYTNHFQETVKLQFQAKLALRKMLLSSVFFSIFKSFFHFYFFYCKMKSKILL